jgi:hypothetical protein
MSADPFDVFDAVFGPSQGEALPSAVPTAEEPPRIVADGPHAKLRRNLDLALDRHAEILAKAITPESDASDKRLVAETATATVKAANSIDRTALAARQDDTLKLVLARMKEEQARLALEDAARVKTIEGD